MPVETSFEVRRMEKSRFLELNHVAMGRAFEIHNRYGNKLDEEIYQQEMAYRLGKLGIGVEREAGLTLRFGKFRKRYVCDLILESGAIFEFKATPSITSRHKQQLLQYLFLTDIPHGRIVNFRPPSVEGWFLNNGVSREERQTPTLLEEDWKEITDDNGLWKTTQSLVADWGTGLFGCNYQEALLLEMGPKHVQTRDLRLTDGGRKIGQRRFHCFHDDSALVVTTHKKRRTQNAKHLQRLLQLTSLSGFRWINIDLHQVHAVFMRK